MCDNKMSADTRERPRLQTSARIS